MKAFNMAIIWAVFLKIVGVLVNIWKRTYWQIHAITLRNIGQGVIPKSTYLFYQLSRCISLIKYYFLILRDAFFYCVVSCIHFIATMKLWERRIYFFESKCATETWRNVGTLVLFFNCFCKFFLPIFN